LGVFFHPWCAPGIKLSEKVQEEIAELLAQTLVADYQKTLDRWARVRQLDYIELDPPRCQAHVASLEGRRVFAMTGTEWERLRAHEGKLLEIDLERAPAGGVEKSASVIACLAADCSVHTERIEVLEIQREGRTEHVFIVKERTDKDRWQAKARALERIVFMTC
jgi:hypothetical protein